MKRTILPDVVLFEFEDIAFLAREGRLGVPLDRALADYPNAETALLSAESGCDLFTVFHPFPPVRIDGSADPQQEGGIFCVGCGAGAVRAAMAVFEERTGFVPYMLSDGILATYEKNFARKVVNYRSYLAEAAKHQVPAERVFGAYNYRTFLARARGVPLPEANLLAGRLYGLLPRE